MRDVEVVTLIHTRLLRHGDGVDADPVRIVDQWWTMDGDLVFEWDAYKREGRRPDDWRHR